MVEDRETELKGSEISQEIIDIFPYVRYPSSYPAFLLLITEKEIDIFLTTQITQK